MNVFKYRFQSIRYATLEEVTVAIKEGFKPLPFYPRHEIIRTIKDLEVDKK